MLNKIIVLNSELYAKASIHVGNSASIQITAENNVGKSSFINTLNFLYIIDKDDMRFEDGRKLPDSMKHYFDGSSQHSFIVFEIFKNGYYCILVKATPENTIEYFKINGEFKDQVFIQSSKEGFKVRKWEQILTDLIGLNPTDPPRQLKTEELYNLVYNAEKNKSPVVWINKEVKRKGRGFTNSFTDVYKYLIKTSDINEKSFRTALLIADYKKDVSLNIFNSSSFDKIIEYEKKRYQLSALKSIKNEFETLKLLNDKFIAEESVLGKMKNTFFRTFDIVEKDLSEKISDSSSLSLSIKTLENRIKILHKDERDSLLQDRATLENEIKYIQIEITGIERQLKEVVDYEPKNENLLYQGLKGKLQQKTSRRNDLNSQLTQLEKTQYTADQMQKIIYKLQSEINQVSSSIGQYSNLLYQNISADPLVVKKVFNYLSPNVSRLPKGNIIKPINNASDTLKLFDAEINIGSLTLEEPPSIDQLKDDLSVKTKELTERKLQLNAIVNRDKLNAEIVQLDRAIEEISTLLQKVEAKPQLQQEGNQRHQLISEKQKKVSEKARLILKKDQDIADDSDKFQILKNQLEEYKGDLKRYKKHYEYFNERTDVYEINEILDISFADLHEKFFTTYEKSLKTRENRKELKDQINQRLKKDIQDIRQFIREVEEEIQNIPQTDKIINTLLDTLSYEIGSPTFSFLTQFNDFKTFLYKSYNTKLAEYPVSNIQEVKVKIYESEELIDDLNKISQLKFSDGLDFDNSYGDSKKALERQLTERKGKAIDISDLFTLKVEITKVTGEREEIDLSKQVQSRGTNIVLKLYLFLNILKGLTQPDANNKVIIYVDELDAIGHKNVKHLIRFCANHNFIPIFAAPRKVEGIQKYYNIKEPVAKSKGKPKITFGELQSFPVEYRNAE
jgi:hypothetical protein